MQSSYIKSYKIIGCVFAALIPSSVTYTAHKIPQILPKSLSKLNDWYSIKCAEYQSYQALQAIQQDSDLLDFSALLALKASPKYVQIYDPGVFRSDLAFPFAADAGLHLKFGL
ncbi:hypothetical protein BJL95_18375 [Methylomonas sp. LWB]|nr:hypothetical protein BJL95_18375 [Methylomonas sp. LWB]